MIENWEEKFLEYADYMAKQYAQKARTDTDSRGAWFSHGVSAAYSSMRTEFYCAKHGIDLIKNSEDIIHGD